MKTFDDAAAGEFLDGRLGDALRIGVLHSLENPDLFDAHLEAAPLEEIAPLAADKAKRDRACRRCR